jgi:hypothetical protein
MNTAFYSLDRTADFGFASVQQTQLGVERQSVDETLLFGQLSAFCTRVLILAGRSPLEQPMLSRMLLAAYAGGVIEKLAGDLDTDRRAELAMRLLLETLDLTVAEAAQHTAALMNSMAAANPRLREIMQRGADAYAEWQACPAEFFPTDFRELVASTAAH